MEHIYIKINDNFDDGFCSYECLNCKLFVFDVSADLLKIKYIHYRNLAKALQPYYGDKASVISCDEMIIKNIIE